MAQLGADTIYLGESVEYRIALKNIKTPAAPDLTAFAADFTVTPAGDQSLNSSSTYIVNGKVWSKDVYGHVYGYHLTPKRAGELTVPAPAATVEGQKVSGEPLTLRVIAPERQDLVLLEIVPSKTQVYPTQPFNVTLRILLKPLPNDNRREPLAPLQEPPLLEINWLNAPEGLRPDGDLKNWLENLVTNTGHGFRLNNVTVNNNDIFSMFEQRAAVFNLYTGHETRAGLNGEKIEYFVYELKRTFTPEKTGTYQFGPASLKGHMDGFSGRRYNSRRVVLFAPPKTVEAKEIPLPRPSTFCGGIGGYDVTVSANPVNARVGDPLTLTLEMRRQPGAGSLALLSAPDLSANAQLAADFEIIDKAPVGEVKEDAKIFAYGLRAKKPGVHIPPLTITLFNPETEQFTDLTTKPVKLNVSTVTRMNAGEIVGAVQSAPTPGIKVREHGIFQNVTDVSELGEQRVQPLKCILGVVAAWSCYLLLSFLVLRHRRLAGDTVWQRRQRAKHDALRQLRNADAALASGRPDEALRLVRESLAGLIGGMLNLPSTGMTTREAGQALENAGLAPEARGQALALLARIEANEYGSAAAQDTAGLLTSAKNILVDLHRALDAK